MPEKTIVNHPLKKWVGVGWITILVIVIAVFAVALAFASSDMNYVEKAAFALLALFIFLLLAGTTLAYYRTTYVIKGGTLYSWSPFAVIRLPLKNIVKVEKTKVPIHFRVGASLYSGIFWIPGVGWTRSIITNLGDALLLYAKGGKKYLITPRDPDRFAKLLKR